ncbi:MAG: hypothetical protein BWY80_00976 [Firmicutes bacterium ADurb.Bin456]|nr:MAG: hypothetical protein BWY80_00976 [Firmicutes bacterium ADurb.Bin456]
MGQVFYLSPASHVDDQGIVRRTSLSCKNSGNGFSVKGVSPKTVDCFGGKRHQTTLVYYSSRFQNSICFRAAGINPNIAGCRPFFFHTLTFPVVKTQKRVIKPLYYNAGFQVFQPFPCPR